MNTGAGRAIHRRICSAPHPRSRAPQALLKRARRIVLKSDGPQSGNRLARIVRQLRFRNLALGAAFLCMFSTARACTGAAADEKWVASWAAAQHGPHPSGNAAAGADLRFAFPDPAAGAHDQTFRLIVKPDLWGNRIRLRFSNVYGDQPLQLDQVYVGIQASGGNVVAETNRRVSFDRGATTEPRWIPGNGSGDRLESDRVPCTRTHTRRTVKSCLQHDRSPGWWGYLVLPPPSSSV